MRIPILAALALLPAGSPLAEPVARDLGGGVYAIQGVFTPGRQPDGNTILLRGPAGWVVVDTGRHAAHARRILEFVDAQGGPIVAVVNTHWHLDHVSGNVALREKHPGLEVYSGNGIVAALGGFLADSRKQLELLLRQDGDPGAKQAMREEIARIDLGDRLRPDVVVREGGERVLAGRKLRLGVAEHAATESDVWIYDASQKLLLAGDLVTLPAPFFDTACAPRWQAALGELEGVGFELLVPGHGEPMSRVQFATYRTAFDGLLACGASPATPAECAQRWSADAAPLLRGTDAGLTKSLVEYYVEYRLRGPGEGRDCPAGGL
jgi:glyoxylase-like metal-dependent hydrolase (beta-lactamase superfamily II)